MKTDRGGPGSRFLTKRASRLKAETLSYQAESREVVVDMREVALSEGRGRVSSARSAEREMGNLGSGASAYEVGVSTVTPAPVNVTFHFHFQPSVTPASSGSQ